MKCNQSRPGFELVLLCPFPTTITITSRAPPFYHYYGEFFIPVSADGFFHWSVSDSNFPPVSRTLLSILADLNKAVLWMISIRPPISNSYSTPFPSHWRPFQVRKLLLLSPFISYSTAFLVLWQSLSTCLSFHFLWFFTLSSAGTAKSTFRQVTSDVLLWTPTYGQAKVGRPARTYIQQLCEDTGCSPEDLPKAMSDREEWRERIRDIRASGTTWWMMMTFIVYYH